MTPTRATTAFIFWVIAPTILAAEVSVFALGVRVVVNLIVRGCPL